MTLTAEQLNSQIALAKTTLKSLETKAAAIIAAPVQTLGPVGPRSNSDEQRLLNAFSCRDLKSLLTVDVSTYAADPMLKAQVLELKKMVDLTRLHAQFYEEDAVERKGKEYSPGEAPLCRTMLTNRTAKKFDVEGRLKAFGSTVAGSGDEYVQTLVSENYLSEFELEFKVGGLFTEITMPSNPFKMPIASGFTTARIIAEGAAATDATFVTSALEFDALKWVEYSLIPEELNEDSVIPFLALARENVIKAHARALETAILNGDESVTHMDSNVTFASDARRSWNGLRKLALANSATVNFNGTGITEAKMAELGARSGRFGVNPAESCYIASSAAYGQMRSLPNVVTVDKFGPLATVKTGVLASYAGIPIVVSQFVPQNLNAAGVHDGITQTMTVLHLVNTSRFMLGRRRPLRVIAQKDPRAEYDRQQVVAYQRLDFKGYPQSATEFSSVLGINILA